MGHWGTVMPSAQDIEQRLQVFRDMCRRRGLKVTAQRLAVFRELASTDEHPDADAILRRVRQRLPHVSLDTVYRILYRLEDEGVISRLQISGDRLRFDGNMDTHHHFVCSHCGRVRDFQTDAIEHVLLPRVVETWGEITRRHLQVRGICRQCLRKRSSRKAR